MSCSRGRLVIAALLGVLAVVPLANSQSYSTCNPLTQGSCPADPALGKTVNIDFTQGASDSFAASGSPSYGSDGAAFTVASSGDSPTISSKWYIMFGHVEFVLKAAPGTGIVSSAILQSDCLDEIDFEWLGGDNAQVQSNYFGKGQTVSGYNRGAFHGAPNNHDQFTTYSIDWTADQIVWSVNGQTVRVLTPETAEANQYPQTPMMIKVGIWAGGDPSNAWGTIQWAGGQTDYSNGPYTMYLKSIHVSDYSTGSSYSYSGATGTWESITSNGGKINSSGKDTPALSSQPSVSTASGAPIPFSTSPEQSSVYATRTGFPWVIGTPTTSTTKSAVATSYSGLPSGWIITDSGKVVPPNTGSTLSPSTSSWPVSPSGSSSVSVAEITTTTYDQQGFPTLTTLTLGASPSTSWDSQGFKITSTSSTSSIGSTRSNDATHSSHTSKTQDGNTPTVLTTTSSTSSSSSSSSSPSFLVTSGVPQAVVASNEASSIIAHMSLLIVTTIIFGISAL